MNVQKYLDERGMNVIIHEHQLRELGLTVIKTEAARMVPASGFGGVLSLYDLKYQSRDEKFSPELIAYLTETIELTPENIEWLEKHAERIAAP